MNNFSEYNRRPINDVVSVNRFLTKTYGMMALAVFVSALTAFLGTTVFQSALTALFSNPASSLILLFLPIGLTFGISFSATRNSTASFIMLMLIAVSYGLVFGIIAMAYTGATLATAFLSASAVFVAMAVYGTTTKLDLSNIGSYAFAALIGLLVATIVNMFLRNSMVTYIFSYIGVIIFTALTAWDAQKMKQIYANFTDQNTEMGLAVAGALQLYLDFINIFMYFLQIFGMGDNRN